MTAIKISAAAAAMVVALSGAAFAQTGMPESHGTNAAGSKSGVVGKGDSLEAGPGDYRNRDRTGCPHGTGQCHAGHSRYDDQRSECGTAPREPGAGRPLRQGSTGVGKG